MKIIKKELPNWDDCKVIEERNASNNQLIKITSYKKDGTINHIEKYDEYGDLSKIIKLKPNGIGIEYIDEYIGFDCLIKTTFYKTDGKTIDYIKWGS